MDTIFTFVDDGDVCALAFLICLLIVIGRQMVSSNLRLHSWGMRLAAGAFLLYCIVAYGDHGDTDAAVLSAIVFRGLLAGAVVLGASWIVLSAGAFVLGPWSEIGRTLRAKADAAKRERDRQEKEREAEVERHRRDEEWERTRPERERQQREAAERAAREARQKTAAQKRREEARLQCETQYSLYAPLVASRFTKEMFESFLTRYMGDSRPPEEVEQRAVQLQGLIEQHRHAVAPPKKDQTIEELAAWFVTERQRIEQLPLDQEIKDEHVALLNARYAELTEAFLQRMQP